MNPEPNNKDEALAYIERYVNLVTQEVKKKWGLHLKMDYKFSDEEAQSDQFNTAIRVVCETLGIGLKEYHSKEGNRKTKYALARKMVAYLMKECFGRGPSWISRRMNKDHSTIIHGFDVMEDLMFSSREIKSDYARCKKTIQEIYELTPVNHFNGEKI